MSSHDAATAVQDADPPLHPYHDGPDHAPDTAPWSSRRLKDALAELGPARPVATSGLAPVAAPVAALPRPLPPPTRPERPPPLADDGLSPADIVRMLAAAAGEGTRAEPPSSPPAPAQLVPEDEERAPRMIERARAQSQQLVGTTAPPRRRSSPLPGLLVGFGLAVMTGGVLYLALTGL